MIASPAGAAPDPDLRLAVTGLSHAVDGRALLINGWVENRGARPVSRLVVDATGFGPSGDQAFFGSDGIPWDIVPGGAERFTIRLPLADQPVRDYLVQVASIQQPRRPLASARRSVDIMLYRPLLLSIVRVSGDIQAGVIIVRSDAGGWPVAGVTVEATVILPRHNRLARVETFTLDLPGRGTTRLGLGADATLLSLRVVDVRLSSVWSD